MNSESTMPDTSAFSKSSPKITGLVVAMKIPEGAMKSESSCYRKLICIELSVFSKENNQASLLLKNIDRGNAVHQLLRNHGGNKKPSCSESPSQSRLRVFLAISQ